MNAFQGVVALAVLGALIAAAIHPRWAGRLIALALFIAASAHTADGVLAIRTGFVRWYSHGVAGYRAKLLGFAKTTFGLIAFVLSFFGIFAFSGGP